MAGSLRPALIGACAVAAVLAAVTAAPATARPTTPTAGAARAVITGSLPGWARAAARVGAVSPGAVRQVQIAVAPRDPAGARALASAEATPGNPLYRQHLSEAEYVTRFGPTASSVAQVRQWLAGQGLHVSGVSANRALITASGRVSTLQTAFGVHLSDYRVTVAGQRRMLVSPDSPVTVPTALAQDVTAVIGLDDAEATTAHVQAAVPAPAPAASGTGCASSWGAANNTGVPQKYPDQTNALCGYLTAPLRQMYGLSAANSGAGQTVAIVGAYSLSTIVSDTDRAAAFAGSPALAPGQFGAVLPAAFDDQSSCNPDSWNAEEALDMQAIHTQAPAAGLLYYAAPDCSSLISAYNGAVSADQASVISDSWTYTGEASVPAADRAAFENAAVEAGVQGQSTVFSTGDNGDDSTATGMVQTNFPATDPWVTAVGGTTSGLDATGGPVVLTGWADAGETQNGPAWTPLPAPHGGFAGGAGGGRSTLYVQPGYQSGVVPAALAHGQRTVPDIAADADPYTGMVVGFTGPGGFAEEDFGGTSEAAPLVAGLLADAEQAAGVTGLGFLNPWLYQAGPSAVTDVTDQASGMWTPDQPACAPTPSQPCATGSYLVDVGSQPQSLTSGPGWDDETGMGTPAAGFVTALAAAATG